MGRGHPLLIPYPLRPLDEDDLLLRLFLGPANTRFQTVYNYIGLGLNFEIRGNGIRSNETKHVELEQFLHVFTSRGFDSVSWAFLFIWRLSHSRLRNEKRSQNYTDLSCNSEKRGNHIVTWFVKVDQVPITIPFVGSQTSHRKLHIKHARYQNMR